MPRARKRHLEIDTITLQGYDEAVASATLNLDRGTMQFWAEYAGQKYAHADAEEVKRLVTEAMQVANTVTWQGVIDVTWGGTADYGAFKMGSLLSYVRNADGRGNVRFAFTRHLYAQFPDGQLRQCHWGCAPEHRLQNAHVWAVHWVGGPFLVGPVHTPTGGAVTVALPVTAPTFTPPVQACTSSGALERRMFLPMTDAYWQGLTLLVEATQQLEVRLAALLSTTEGHAQLAAAALPFALPAPVDTDDR